MCTPLVSLYNKLNCGLCRFSIIEILYKNEVLPENILEEMEYDSDSDTRELFLIIAGNKPLHKPVGC